MTSHLERWYCRRHHITRDAGRLEVFILLMGPPSPFPQTYKQITGNLTICCGLRHHNLCPWQLAGPREMVGGQKGGVSSLQRLDFQALMASSVKRTRAHSSLSSSCTQPSITAQSRSLHAGTISQPYHSFQHKQSFH